MKKVTAVVRGWLSKHHVALLAMFVAAAAATGTWYGGTQNKRTADTAIAALNRAEERDMEGKENNRQLLEKFARVVDSQDEATKNNKLLVEKFSLLVARMDEDIEEKKALLSQYVAILDILADVSEETPQKPYVSKSEILERYNNELKRKHGKGVASLQQINEARIGYILYQLQTQGLVSLVHPGRKYMIAYVTAIDPTLKSPPQAGIPKNH